LREHHLDLLATFKSVNVARIATSHQVTLEV